MKISKYILILLCLHSLVQGQQQKNVITIKSRYGFDVQRRPVVNFNIIPVFSGTRWLPELYLSAEIQNDRLQFVKKDDAYETDYQISVIIRREKETLFKQNWEETEELKDFEQTNSKEIYQYKVYRLDLSMQDRQNLRQPGEYECIFQVLDLTSEKSYKSMRKFKLDDEHPDEFRTGPVNFLKSSNDGNYKLPFIPSDGALLYGRPYTAYVNVLTDTIDTIRINARLYKIENEDGNLFYQRYFNISRDSAVTNIKFTLPYDSMSPGQYRLSFNAYSGDKVLSAEKEFEVYWYDRPVYLYKADLAVRPMRYLISEAEYKKVDDMSYNEKEAWLKAYWASHDPTENTDYNELEAEFFNRVQTANEKYALRYKEGWETARGKILLLYGEPDKIENRMSAANQKPHVVWIYNKNNLTFLFVDSNRDGEFELVTQE
jgi:GWxTD domain-containing protein